MFENSHLLNIQNALNSCRLADGTLLRDCDANTKFGKAYRYWLMAPSDLNDWALLGIEAPDEVKTIGRYLITIERINASATYESNPEWMKRNPSCSKKIAIVILVAGIIGLFTASIFFALKYRKQ